MKDEETEIKILKCKHFVCVECLGKLEKYTRPLCRCDITEEIPVKKEGMCDKMKKKL